MVALTHYIVRTVQPGYSAQEACDRLVMLRDCGYRVPDYAIEALRDEAEPRREDP